MSALPTLSGRSVAVLGATGGVGEGATRGLLERGARVVALGRSQAKLDELAGRVDHPDRLSTYVVDVSAGDPARLTRDLVAAVGPLDGALISIGDPGRGGDPDVLRLGDDDLMAMVRDNELLGLRALRVLVPAVRPEGAVVNLLGFSSEVPFPGNPLMGSMNAARRSLITSLAAQLDGRGPRVHGLVIGVVRTRARQQAGIDDPRWLSGEQVGDATTDLILGDIVGAGGDQVVHHLLDPGSSRARA